VFLTNGIVMKAEEGVLFRCPECAKRVRFRKVIAENGKVEEREYKKNTVLFKGILPAGTVLEVFCPGIKCNHKWTYIVGEKNRFLARVG